jgi:hypothetical protein
VSVSCFLIRLYADYSMATSFSYLLNNIFMAKDYKSRKASKFHYLYSFVRLSDFTAVFLSTTTASSVRKMNMQGHRSVPHTLLMCVRACMCVCVSTYHTIYLPTCLSIQPKSILSICSSSSTCLSAYSHGLICLCHGEISGSHGGEYEDGCLLGCCSVNVYQTVRRNIPDYNSFYIYLRILFTL